MASCNPKHDPMARERSNFNLDLIHVILGMFDNDQAAKSLLWVIQELDKKLEFFSDARGLNHWISVKVFFDRKVIERVIGLERSL